MRVEDKNMGEAKRRRQAAGNMLGVMAHIMRAVSASIFL